MRGKATKGSEAKAKNPTEGDVSELLIPTLKHLTWLNVCGNGGGRSSLFCFNISDKENNFNCVDFYGCH